MKRLKGKLNKWLGKWSERPVLEWLLVTVLFAVVEYWVFKTNYVKGTWLVGWDSTMPELNFRLHLWRGLNAVWQEYRGVGVLDGMAHAANLAHWVYIRLLAFVLPVNLVRYVFILGMHWLGGLGMYVYTRGLELSKKKVPWYLAVAAGFLYMFNPLTIQMFYAPLELFVIHFGFLPWMLWSLNRYIKSGLKKDLVVMAGINLLALSQAHVPTIFIVYAAVVGIYLLIAERLKFKERLKRMVAVIGVIFVINAFWGLPYVYSALKNAETITDSKMNRLSNQEIVLRNDAFGDLSSLATLRGFSLNFEDWVADREFDYQMKVWREWWYKPGVERVLWGMSGLMFVGLLVVLLKRDRQLLPVVGAGVFAAVNLGAKILVLGWLGQLLRKFIPYYEEIFRFAFTKFSIIYAFSWVVLIVVGVMWLTNVVKRKRNLVLMPIALSLMTLIWWVAKPVSEGEFLYPKLKLEIPQGYFEMFDFFETQDPATRVAVLPQPSLYGWGHMKWGYRGSGFVWQGIQQPLLHRAFDPWSNYNEGYYLELSTAVARESSGDLLQVMNKYMVDWVVVDENIFIPGGWEKSYDVDLIDEMLAKMDEFELARELDSGIRVYKRKISVADKFVWSPQTYMGVMADYDRVRDDRMFTVEGDYALVEREFGLVQYPFASVYREKLGNASYNEDILGRKELVLEGEMEEGVKGALQLQPFSEGERLAVRVDFDYRGNQLQIVFKDPITVEVDGKVVVNYNLPEIKIDTGEALDKIILSLSGSVFEVGQGAYLPGENVVLRVGQPLEVVMFDPIPLEAKIDESGFLNSQVNKCWERPGAEGKVETLVADGYLQIKTKDASGCFSVKVGQVDSAALVNVSLPYRSIDGARPSYCLVKAGGEYKCENEDVYYLTSGSEDWTEVNQDVVVLGQGEYWMDVSTRASDEKGLEWGLEYKKPIVKVYPELMRRVYPLGVWDKFLEGQNIELKGANKVVVRLGTYIESKDLSVGGDVENCDVFDRGDVSVVRGNAVKYRAVDLGATCDTFAFDKLSAYQGNVVRIKGENISGRGLKVYLNNVGGERNDIEELLPNGKFDNSLVLLPWANVGDTGYRLVLENRSFGSELAENTVEEIEAYSIPVEWLARIKLVDETNPVESENQLKVEEVEKNGTFRYISKVNGSGLISLAQAYETGWEAYDVKQGLWGEKLEHVRVNGWENGWMVTTDNLEQAESGFGNLIGQVKAQGDELEKNGIGVIVMVYWPMYLEWLGLGLLAVSASGAVIMGIYIKFIKNI